MSERMLVTLTEAATRLGVNRVTVGDLVRKLELAPKAMTNGQAKGLDESDMEALRHSLEKVGRGKRSRITSHST